jgi:hypothetical protein
VSRTTRAGLSVLKCEITRNFRGRISRATLELHVKHEYWSALDRAPYDQRLAYESE